MPRKKGSPKKVSTPKSTPRKKMPVDSDVEAFTTPTKKMAAEVNSPRLRTPLLERIGEMRGLFVENNEQVQQEVQQENVEDGEVRSDHDAQRNRSPSQDRRICIEMADM